MSDDVRRDAWEISYSRRQNYVFSPADEVVRFVSRHLRRRVGLDEIVDVIPGAAGSPVLDVGCGIGRNLVFGTQMGLDMYGMDLSETAVATARAWLERIGVTDAGSRAVAADVRQLPWKDGAFSHAMSDSVLDSMPFPVAVEGVAEVARVVRPNGYFYCNLISGDETGRSADFAGEVVVSGAHEQDTIQSYFDRNKIDDLLGRWFKITRIELHQVRDLDRATHHGRWHIVSQRR